MTAPASSCSYPSGGGTRGAHAVGPGSAGPKKAPLQYHLYRLYPKPAFLPRGQRLHAGGLTHSLDAGPAGPSRPSLPLQPAGAPAPPRPASSQRRMAQALEPPTTKTGQQRGPRCWHGARAGDGCGRATPWFLPRQGPAARVPRGRGVKGAEPGGSSDGRARLQGHDTQATSGARGICAGRDFSPP